jgi:putative mRNA 3-end processing factor
MASDLLKTTTTGLGAPDSSFHIDAWGAARVNLVTHAHSDHARVGAEEYWCSKQSAPILRLRLGADIKLREFAYGEKAKLGKHWISFHSAGHILGSSQIRVEKGSDVWVVSGDYKRDPDPSCDPFEVVKCGTLITEATFGLPIYDWRPMGETAREIFDWWQWCKEEKTTAVLYCYSLGKSQRVLAELLRFTNEPVLLHGAVANLTRLYREQGIAMLPTIAVNDFDPATQGSFEGRLVIAPPSAHRSTWMKRFPSVSTAFASGWMAVRGIRRRRGYERGFVLSDHADWKGLVRTVEECEASRILVTHGSTETLSHYLREVKGLDSQPLGHALAEHFGGEKDGS